MIYDPDKVGVELNSVLRAVLLKEFSSPSVPCLKENRTPEVISVSLVMRAIQILYSRRKNMFMTHSHHTLACATILSNDFWSMLSAIMVGSVAAASFTSEARRSFNAPSFASELELRRGVVI